MTVSASDFGRDVGASATGTFLDTSHHATVDEALRASEERFRRLFYGHAACMLILDPGTGRITDANDAAARFYGWSIDQLRTMRIQQINTLPPEAVEREMSAAASSSKASFEFQHRLADGSIRDVEVFSNRVETGGGGAVLYSIVHDISDRKRIEHKLKESEERLRLLAENASDVIFVRDMETTGFRYVSPSVTRQRGYAVEEAMQQSVEDSMTPASYAAICERMPDRIHAFNSGGADFHTDVIEQHCKDGSTVWVEVHNRYARNEHTGHIEVIGVSHDITERLRVEAALQRTAALLQRAEDVARLGHWEFCLDDRILHASAGAARIYGFDDTEISLGRVQACALGEYLDGALRDLIENGKPYDTEFRIRNAATGRIVDVHSRAEFDQTTRMVFGIVQDITERKRIEVEREKLILQLESAIEHVKTLKGIVPICSSCKKIRDDRGFWEQVEAYVSRHTEAQFSHGICPDCLDTLYPDLAPLLKAKTPL